MEGVETGLLIGGGWVSTERRFTVVNPYCGATVAEVCEAGTDDVEAALTAASPPSQTPYERSEVLLRVRDRIAARDREIIRVMVAESGFTVKDATGEVTRCLQTLTLCAEEAKRLAGEVVPFSGAPGGANRLGWTRLEPLGIVVAITPFNSPLNTVAHKVGPAFAAGNAVILKPAEKTPLTAAMLCAAFIEAGAPPGSISLLQGKGSELGPALLDDPRPAFYAFTGSTSVGRKIHTGAGLRRTQMELGSIAATIVLSDADLDNAAAATAGASFRKAGQVCTSVQLLLLERSIEEAFTERYLDRVAALNAGDPSDPVTDVGPVISPEAADRITSWVDDAAARGARVLTGARRQETLLSPTVLVGVDQTMDVACREIFGPVTCLIGVADVDEAIDRVNATPYGLATGVYTNDIGRAQICTERLDVGSVHINQTCSSRIDLMPYGGFKDSGFGHEGPRYAIREMTREKLVSFTFH